MAWKSFQASTHDEIRNLIIMIKTQEWTQSLDVAPILQNKK